MNTKNKLYQSLESHIKDHPPIVPMQLSVCGPYHAKDFSKETKKGGTYFEAYTSLMRSEASSPKPTGLRPSDLGSYSDFMKALADHPRIKIKRIGEDHNGDGRRPVPLGDEAGNEV